MGRRPRVHAPGAYYHVTLRGNQRQAIFRDDNDRALLDEIIVESLRRFEARAHAYCWMTNHIHLLVQVGDEPLSRVMHRVASCYAHAFQRSLATSGHLFERRHHAVLIGTDAHLVAAVVYIHLNPVWAGMVSDPARYRWSSHAAYATGATSWVTTGAVLATLHDDEAHARPAYDRLVRSRMSDAALAACVGGPDLLTSAALSALADALLPQRAALSRDLEAIVLEACARAGFDPTSLHDPSRNPRVAALRASIAREALAAGAGTMVQICARLGRSASSVSRLAKKGGGAR
jgi:putative transposase